MFAAGFVFLFQAILFIAGLVVAVLVLWAAGVLGYEHRKGLGQIALGVLCLFTIAHFARWYNESPATLAVWLGICVLTLSPVLYFESKKEKERRRLNQEQTPTSLASTVDTPHL